MQATTVATATSNSKDGSNIMTAHSSRNTSNSRNKSNNRTANTVWMPAKAGMLLKSEIAVAAGTIASSWRSSTVGPIEKPVEKTTTFSRDTNNSSKNSHLEHSATAAETIGTSQMSTEEGRTATARMTEIVQTNQQQ